MVTRFSYWGITLLFSITAYGFSMLNRTISIDDLAKDLYIGRGQKCWQAHAGEWNCGIIHWE